MSVGIVQRFEPQGIGALYGFPVLLLVLHFLAVTTIYIKIG